LGAPLTGTAKALFPKRVRDFAIDDEASETTHSAAFFNE
jgi:hypothetical protein